MTLRTYRNLLGLGFGAAFAAIWILAVLLQPADGDLARVGGYPEKDFHWKTPQAVFPKNLFTVSHDLADYDRHYDVVVLGDSFSCDQEGRHFGWQNYFLAETGLSMIVFDTRRFWPQEIFDLPIFKTSPPKLFIFESVERYLHMRTAYFAKHERVSSNPPPEPGPFPRHPLPALQEHIPVARPSLDPEHVLTHLNSLTLRLLNLNTQVIKTNLTTDQHFSSPSNRELLVYFDEYTKKDLTETDFQNMRTGLKTFQSLVESNGVTKFVVLVAPDKSSLYAPWLADADMATVNLIAEAAKDPDLPLLRTDLILAGAMEAPDLYLPSDSHWSSRGHRLVTGGLLNMLEARKIPTTPGKLRSFFD